MDRALRNALNNHVIIVMVFVDLILQFIDVTALTYYWRTGTALVSTRAFCFTWVSIHSIGIVGAINLVAWASIERHILIFHPKLVRTKTKRFFLHYLPLVICMMCPGVFYVTIFFIVPCSITMDYTKIDCGYYSCIGVIRSVGFAALIIRVLASKYRAGQQIQWRNYRKMAIQLLSISFLYIFLCCPSIFIYTAYMAGLPQNIATGFYSDMSYFSYYARTLTPFICALSMPELRTKFKTCFPCCRRRRAAVAPQALLMTRPTAAIAAIAQ
ncbi:unnamed protein product [Adineta steineri]|uniref:Uncharacterized protein n=2 Tax=Adineta steineri TaxID=433720 RepID=A0A819TDQ0_9BILA|nr:unnamed protein product [Adineta steineri]CAF4071282.1 unnamed protein product [Adineta steineri]